MRLGLLLAQPVAVAPQSALRPAGEGAAEIGWLWNLMLWLGTAITIVVLAALVYALLRRRPPGFVPEADRPPDPRGERANVESGGRGHEDQGRPRSEAIGTRWIVGGGAVFPAVVLVALFILTMVTMGALYPRRGARPPLTIDVTGRQWWWEVRYAGAQPGDMVVSANEVHIPVGERVRLRLHADDVIHSFWVPGLQGKTDMIPGRVNESWIQASRAGSWRGQCAEFCGTQHAKMALVVVAEPRAEFEAWLARERLPAAEPRDSATLAARTTFLGTGCVLCHTVRGTEARGRTGPDLTHVGSRRTLAAGELPNNLGNLHGWIANPQALKPGSHMPAVPLTQAQLHQVASYLRSLR